MHILIRNKKKEPKMFKSVEEMVDDIQERHNNRNNFQKIIDFIKYRIVWDYIHPLHPRILYWRTKNFIQKKLWDFNDYELMDLDVEFSKWIIPKLKEISTSDVCIQKMIRAFELNMNMDDELDYSRPFNMEKYKLDSAILNKEMFEGLMIFVKNFRLFYCLEIEVIDWILPRLKRFMVTVQTYPSGHINENGLFEKEQTESFDNWQVILNDIITSFEFIQFQTTIRRNTDNELYLKYMDKEIDKGLKFFAMYFSNLRN